MAKRKHNSEWRAPRGSGAGGPHTGCAGCADASSSAAAAAPPGQTTAAASALTSEGVSQSLSHTAASLGMAIHIPRRHRISVPRPKLCPALQNSGLKDNHGLCDFIHVRKSLLSLVHVCILQRSQCLYNLTSDQESKGRKRTSRMRRHLAVCTEHLMLAMELTSWLNSASTLMPSARIAFLALQAAGHHGLPHPLNHLWVHPLACSPA